MSRLWKWINEKKKCGGAKTRWFLFLNSLKYAAIGLCGWLIVSRFALNTWDWMLCFVGYPGFFVGYIGGYIYLCRK